MLWAKRIVLVALGIVVLPSRQDQGAGLALAGGDQPRHLRGADHRRGLRAAARARHDGRLDPARRARLRRLPELVLRRDGARLHDGRDRRLSPRLPAGDRLPRPRRPPRLGPQRPRHGGGAPRRQRAHLRPGPALARLPDRRRPLRPGEVRLGLGPDPRLGPDALPDRRRDQARPCGAHRPRRLEARRRRPG